MQLCFRTRFSCARGHLRVLSIQGIRNVEVPATTKLPHVFWRNSTHARSRNSIYSNKMRETYQSSLPSRWP